MSVLGQEPEVLVLCEVGSVKQPWHL